MRIAIGNRRDVHDKVAAPIEGYVLSIDRWEEIFTPGVIVPLGEEAKEPSRHMGIPCAIHRMRMRFPGKELVNGKQVWNWEPSVIMPRDILGPWNDVQARITAVAKQKVSLDHRDRAHIMAIEGQLVKIRKAGIEVRIDRVERVGARVWFTDESLAKLVKILDGFFCCSYPSGTPCYGCEEEHAHTCIECERDWCLRCWDSDGIHSKDCDGEPKV